MKSIGRVIRLSAVLLALVSPVLQAATISLEISGDATLSAALAAYNAAHSTSYVDTDGGVSLGANDIEVSGTGVLTFSEALGSWTGNLTVKAGGIVRAVISETTVLGNATTGAVYIEDGATLRSDDSNGAGNNKSIARTVYIAGKGASGEGGALRFYVRAYVSYRSTVPKNIVLTADASFSFGSSPQEVVCSYATIDLQSHTLTITADGCPATAFPRFYYEYTYVKNPGHIRHDHGIADIRSMSNFGGSVDNTLTLTNGAVLYFDSGAGNIGMMPDGWTMDIDSSAGSKLYVLASPRTVETTSTLYPGPVLLGRSLAFDEKDSPYSGNNALATNAFGFAGTVTGDGGFSVSSPRTRDLNYFRLDAANNAFAGGLAATNFTVRLKSPTAIPSGAQAGALTLKDSDVWLDYGLSDAANFAFPRTVFDGAGVIGAKDGFANGSFESLTKTGSGELTLRAGVASMDELSLDGGRVTFLCGRSSVAGVQVGEGPRIEYYSNPFSDASINSKFSPDCSVKDFSRNVLYTNGVSMSFPSIFYTPHGVDTVRPATDADDFDSWNGWADPSKNGWSSSFLWKIITGAGYLWNGSNEPKTIRVICTLNAYGFFKFGDQTALVPASGKKDDLHRNHPGTVKNRGKPSSEWEYASSTPYDPWLDMTVTLPPGATRVEVRIWDRFGNLDGNARLCYGNICTNGLANWDDAHGLMWTEKLDSKDMNDYHKFEDAGDGKFLMTETPVGLSSHLQIGTLAGSGGEVDLDEIQTSVTALSGKPVVLNGSVSLTGVWTLTAADVMDGTPLEAVDLAGCSQVAMSAEEVGKLVRVKGAVTEYVLAKNATAAVPVCDALAAKGWQAVLKDNGDLVLQRLPPGMIMIFR